MFLMLSTVNGETLNISENLAQGHGPSFLKLAIALSPPTRLMQHALLAAFKEKK